MRNVFHIVSVFLLLVLAVPGQSLAADQWEFTIAPYALFPYIEGEASVGQVSGANVDVDPGDIIDTLELGGMIYLEAQHASGFGASLNYAFMDLADGATGPAGIGRVDLDIFQGILEGYGQYRLKAGKGTLDVYAGVRWWDIDLDINISGVGPTQSLKRGAEWVDPVVGLRWIPQIGKRWQLILKGDIGGFGAASDFSWNLQGGASWDATESLSLVLQYRALGVDYSTGTSGTADYFSYDTVTHGPLIGLAFHL